MVLKQRELLALLDGLSVRQHLLPADLIIKTAQFRIESKACALSSGKRLPVTPAGTQLNPRGESRHENRASIKRPRRVPVSPSNAVKCYPCRSVPLNYSESLLFHGGNTGSTPVRDANTLKTLDVPPRAEPRKFTRFSRSVFRC